MENFNRNLNFLAEIRKNLTNPLFICKLAKYLKRNLIEFNIDDEINTLSPLPPLPGLYYIEAKFNFKTLAELDNFRS